MNRKQHLGFISLSNHRLIQLLLLTNPRVWIIK